MNDNFKSRKDTLIAIKKEISLLQHQVDYLLRNEQPLGLLDLDVLMNRTHTLYDLMCGMEVENEELGMESEDEELPIEPEMIRSVFGIEEETPQEEPVLEKEEELVPEKEEIPEEEPLPEEEPIIEEPIEEPISMEEELIPEEEHPLPIEEPVSSEEEEVFEENEDAYFEEEVEDEPTPEEVPVESTRGDDLGFILNFEPTEDAPKEETEPSPSTFTTGDEIEMTIPHEEIEYEPVVIGDVKDDDSGFELDTVETLGERYQQGQEETLGEKLQHGAVKDLQSAIGINDKFLFVNELFGGSMEKYNRAIENLNDLKTLNGALIYMNELRIELQWNSSNEAYKKLLELVHRKYES
jgi:hypothetical protein